MGMWMGVGGGRGGVQSTKFFKHTKKKRPMFFRDKEVVLWVGMGFESDVVAVAWLFFLLVY